MIEETQEALINFEPKSPEPRDNNRNHWQQTRSMNLSQYERSIESAPWNDASCSSSRPKIPKLSHQKMHRVSPSYELPSQSDEGIAPHMNHHLLQNSIPVLNTNSSGYFRQYNRKSRYPPRQMFRRRVGRASQRMRPFTNRSQINHTTEFERPVRPRRASKRGRMWIRWIYLYMARILESGFFISFDVKEGVLLAKFFPAEFAF